MDPKRFDALSRSLAGSSSRRRSLGFLGGGGLLLGLGRERALAAGTICRLQLTASVQVGSDKKHDYSGLLTLQIGDGGAIDQGGLATNDGFHFAVVGQIDDRLVGL